MYSQINNTIIILIACAIVIEIGILTRAAVAEYEAHPLVVKELIISAQHRVITKTLTMLPTAVGCVTLIDTK